MSKTLVLISPCKLYRLQNALALVLISILHLGIRYKLNGTAKIKKLILPMFGSINPLYR